MVSFNGIQLRANGGIEAIRQDSFTEVLSRVAVVSVGDLHRTVLNIVNATLLRDTSHLASTTCWAEMAIRSLEKRYELGYSDEVVPLDVNCSSRALSCGIIFAS